MRALKPVVTLRPTLFVVDDPLAYPAATMDPVPICTSISLVPESDTLLNTVVMRFTHEGMPVKSSATVEIVVEATV